MLERDLVKNERMPRFLPYMPLLIPTSFFHMKPIDFPAEVSQQLHGATVTHVTPATEITPWSKPINKVVNLVSNTCSVKENKSKGNGQNYWTRTGPTVLQKRVVVSLCTPSLNLKRWCLVGIAPILSGVETEKKTEVFCAVLLASFVHLEY